jgi:hypothetical protein
MRRVGHRLLNIDVSPSVEKSVDAVTNIRVGGDVEEIGVKLVEPRFVRDHLEAVRVAEISGSRPRIKAIDSGHAKFQCSGVN